MTSVKRQYEFGKGKYEARVSGTMNDGDMVITRIIVSDLEEDGEKRGLDSTKLRTLPLRELKGELRDKLYQEQGMPAELAQPFPLYGTEAFWMHCTKVYLWCEENKRPPVVTLSKLAGVHYDTAKRWVKLLRQKGHLPPYEAGAET